MSVQFIFATPISIITLPQDGDMLSAIAAKAIDCHYEREASDAAFGQRTGRQIRSHPDLLTRLSDAQKRYLLGPINAAVREMYRVGLGDSAAHERQYAVRGFGRVCEPGERTRVHSHCDVDLVVAFYANAGGTQQTPPAPLVLIDPVHRNNRCGAQTFSIAVHDAMAVIFPAYLLHESEPSVGRRVIAGLEFTCIGHPLQKQFTPIKELCHV